MVKLEIGLWAVGILVGIVVLFKIVGGVIPEAQPSADVLAQSGTELTDSTVCASVGCFWNATRSVDCTKTNVTALDTTVCANTRKAIPLGSLFGRSGVMILVLMAGLLLLVFYSLVPKKNK